MSMLHVSNLPPETTPAQLEEIFARHGQVVCAKMAVSHTTGQLQNFGQVEMPEEDAQWACETLHRSWYKNNCIEVQYSRTQYRNNRPYQKNEAKGNHSKFKDQVYLVSGF
jgi:RNA recognition motif-containing protein